jgi:hypothetical protein
MLRVYHFSGISLSNIKHDTAKNRQDIVLKRMTQNEEDETVEIAVPATVFFSNAGKILVNSPGLGCPKEGENGKFTEIADLLQKLEVASVILYHSSLSDFAFKKVSMEALLMDNLRAVLNYALKESQMICGLKKPVVYAAGHSAGASTTAAVAPEYSCVAKMLLIAPSVDIHPTLVKRSLARFKGEINVISGDRDYVISPEAVQSFGKWATKAKFTRIATVPNCDHDFSGEANRHLLGKAYLWAFDEHTLSLL